MNMESACRVEITYLDGTQEAVREIPTYKMASDIYAQAVTNDRVREAVLYRENGSVVSTYRVAVNHPALRPRDLHSVLMGASESARAALDTIPQQGPEARCKRVWRPEGVTGVFRSCKRVRGHLGRHADGATFADSTVQWDDNECS